MILDKLALFDDKTLLTTWIVGANLSAFSYDTGLPDTPRAIGPGGGIGGPLLHDIGRGRPIWLLVQIGTAATSGGASTLIARFVSADNGPLTTNLTPILQTPDTVIPLATIAVAGYRFPFKTVPGKVTRQFVGMQYAVGGFVYTGGTITAGLVLGTDDHADILGVAP